MNDSKKPSRKLLWALLILIPVAVAVQWQNEQLKLETARFIEGSSPKAAILESEDYFSEEERVGMTIDRRPIFARDDRVYVWANGQRNSEDTVWFDMSDSILNPAELKHGIGKDAITSIDKPEFVKLDDPQMREWKRSRHEVFRSNPVSNNSPVIGVEINGEARAYPIVFLNSHELVNDVYGEAHVTVAW